jgi:hypothetical protein
MSKREERRHSHSPWKLGLFYYCPQDRRVFVPKASFTGWTVNWARPLAVPLVLTTLAVPWGAVELARAVPALALPILLLGLGLLLSLPLLRPRD